MSIVKSAFANLIIHYLFEDLMIVSLHFLSCEHPVLLYIAAVKRKSSLVDTPSNEKIGLII